MYVAETLGKWYDVHKRNLPWRNSGNPYHIWLSEIILQQTRVNQGIGYYHRFIEKFPDIRSLAEASIDEVLKLWQGLGYYTRARNMHITAREIVDQNNGIFPSDYASLLKLKGIGPYTAAAIASIAFAQPVSLVDGNVARVLSRLYAVEIPVDSGKGKEEITRLAESIMDHRHPGIHNQALMEFGALVCLPVNPLCNSCILSDICSARAKGLVETLPLKKQKKTSKTRYFNYVVIKDGTDTYIKKRNDRDIWHSLYEFPLLESEKSILPEELLKSPWTKSMFADATYSVEDPVKIYRHILTHQTLICSFMRVNLLSPAPHLQQWYLKIPVGELNKYAIPRVIDIWLDEITGKGLL